MARTPYPQYDVMRELDHWDAQTQQVVRDRIHSVPSIRFFDAHEAATLTAVADRIIPQGDRAPDQRIPITPFIDEMLVNDSTDGFREPDMPWAQELWRRGLTGIEETSDAMRGCGFRELDDADRDAVLARLQAGDAPGPTWTSLPPQKFFTQLVQQIASVYYAHPAAWSEIGWGGPASPRGYVRTGYGMRDPWEAEERADTSSVALIRRCDDRQARASGTGGATH